MKKKKRRDYPVAIKMASISSIMKASCHSPQYREGKLSFMMGGGFPEGRSSEKMSPSALYHKLRKGVGREGKT